MIRPLVDLVFALGTLNFSTHFCLSSPATYARHEKKYNAPLGKRYAGGRGCIKDNRAERVKMEEISTLKGADNAAHGSDIHYECDQFFGLCNANTIIRVRK